MRPAPLPELASRLCDANDFVGIAVQVCAVASQLGASECAMTLYAQSGRPVLRVDNVPSLSRNHRVDYFAQHWIGDPTLRALREHHAPIEDAGELAIPLLEPGALLGSIRLCRLDSRAPRRDLCALGTHVSVRLAQLGITAPAESRPFSCLTHRQLWVALLAARGDYERISISNRTELASRIALASVPHVSEHADVVVTRA
jgi:hypothetical protein